MTTTETSPVVMTAAEAAAIIIVRDALTRIADELDHGVIMAGVDHVDYMARRTIQATGRTLEAAEAAERALYRLLSVAAIYSKCPNAAKALEATTEA